MIQLTSHKKSSLEAFLFGVRALLTDSTNLGILLPSLVVLLELRARLPAYDVARSNHVGFLSGLLATDS